MSRCRRRSRVVSCQSIAARAFPNAMEATCEPAKQVREVRSRRVFIWKLVFGGQRAEAAFSLPRMIARRLINSMCWCAPTGLSKVGILPFGSSWTGTLGPTKRDGNTAMAAPRPGLASGLFYSLDSAQLSCRNSQSSLNFKDFISSLSSRQTRCISPD